MRRLAEAAKLAALILAGTTVIMYSLVVTVIKGDYDR